MTNGCICCTLRDDPLKEVSALVESGRFDCLVIEVDWRATLRSRTR
jgi:G3E family GTPase